MYSFYLYQSILIVFVLDDPLSAVDAHVGKALLNTCILDTLKANQKAIVLVTHQLQYLPYADNILVLNTNGEQTFYGCYDELQQHSDILTSLDMKNETSDPKKILGDENDNGNMTLKKSTSISRQLSTMKSSRYDANYRTISRKFNQTNATTTTVNNNDTENNEGVYFIFINQRTICIINCIKRLCIIIYIINYVLVKLIHIYINVIYI